MNVRDIMASPPVSVTPDTRVGEVARIVVERGLTGVPVVDGRGRVVGVVTENDLVAKHANVHVPRYLGILGVVLPFETRSTEDELRHVLAVQAKDLMSRDVPTLDVDASVEDAATLMVERNVEPIPVLEGGRLVGSVSRADIIRLLVVEEADVESAP